jgi:hypothetical protein
VSDELVLPTLCESRTDVLLSLIDFVHEKVLKPIQDIARIRARLSYRTVATIPHDSDTLAFGPCPDRTRRPLMRPLPPAGCWT